MACRVVFAPQQGAHDDLAAVVDYGCGGAGGVGAAILKAQ